MDSLIGGSGNDTYIVTDNNDIITELAGKTEGTDTIQASIDWTLGANFEKLLLVGTNAMNGTGNTLANTLIANDANNVLIGDAGNDTIEAASGIDTLNGGSGNDSLRINDFSLDSIDGGTGTDTLQIANTLQQVDLNNANLKNIEAIKFADDSDSTLLVTAKTVLNLSSDSDSLKIDADGENTLVMETGWTDKGIIKGYQTFIKDGATLSVNPNIGNIDVIQLPAAYTIADAASAAAIAGVFDSGVQEITIDFGGKAYSDWGLVSIDLTGFGLEDKLMVAQHDGSLHNSTARYFPDYRSAYIVEGTGWRSDRVSWAAGATKANLISSQFTTRYTYSAQAEHVSKMAKSASGSSSYSSTYTSTYTYTSYTPTFTTWTMLGKVELTGLPAGLPDSQFVFV